ncbi:MAG: protein kinase [Myxococcales bacterium]
MSTPHRHHRWLGQVIADRYRVLELLGEGGMGAVYIAEHLMMHKQVALKVVHPEHAGNAELAARFAREAMATSRIDHPNVVSALDFGTLPDGTAFLAVQLVRGPSLTKVLQAEGKLHWARAADLGAQLADALCAAHGYGIVHRDLKPDNVLLQFLDDGGELVKVLDFGVAKFDRESLAPPSMRNEAQVTQLGIVIGTPGYMAPEQAIGNPADHRADLYALGVILWECMAGTQLWAGAHDLQSLVERQLSQVPPRLKVVSGDAGMPDLLEDLVASLLARRADNRPNDATLVREQLRAIAQLDVSEQPRWRTGSRRVGPGLRDTRTPTTGTVNMPPANQNTQPNTQPNLFPPPVVPATRSSVSTAAPLPQAPTDAFAATVPPPAGGTGAMLMAALPEEQKPALSSLPPKKKRGSWVAWLITLLLTTILGAAVFLVATGQIEVRPQGQVAEVAQVVAQQLNLPPPKPADADHESEPSGPTKTGLPAALEPDFERLVAAEERDDRVNAANAMLGHLPIEEIPQYVRRMAYLQLAKTCPQKRDEITQLAEIGDARALPLLVRMSQKPRNGCGKKHREDCLACLRKPLEDLIDVLEKQPESADTATP